MKYWINWRGKVISSYLEDCKTILHSLLWATLSQATPDQDLIQNDNNLRYQKEKLERKITIVNQGFGVKSILDTKLIHD